MAASMIATSPSLGGMKYFPPIQYGH